MSEIYVQLCYHEPHKGFAYQHYGAPWLVSDEVQATGGFLLAGAIAESHAKTNPERIFFLAAARDGSYVDIFRPDGTLIWEDPEPTSDEIAFEEREAIYQAGVDEGRERSLKGRLTDHEFKVISQTAELWNSLQSVVGTGPMRDSDLRELMVHVHAIQNCVLSQAARRAYPERFRMLGEIGDWGKGEG